jgi:SecD/SecF fusion protein
MSRLRAIYDFDFMGHKKWWFSLSAAVILAGLVSLVVNGDGNPLDGLRYGLEFTTGTRIEVALESEAALEDVRRVVTEAGHEGAQIQQVSRVGDSDLAGFIIQTSELTPDEQAALKDRLEEGFGIAEANGTQVYAQQTVGPTFGELVVEKSLQAAALAVLLITAYVTIRFQWRFAVGALVAVLHDLLVVIGVYSLTGREVTTATIAAVLTFLGYSLYDTVIIYDRIRENMPKMAGVPFADVANLSISQTLTRSLNTSFTTLLPVVCLLLFGGSTLKDFAFALVVGIISGAYSTIFIASPVVTVLMEREPKYRRLAARAAEEA